MKRQISIALCAALAASVAGCLESPGGPAVDLGGGRDIAARPADMTDLTVIDPLGANPQVAKINTGIPFQFTQSPLWLAKTGVLLFTDLPNNIIYQLTLPATATSYRASSGGSNGLALDAAGNLVVTEITTRQVSRRDAGGTYTPLASMYMGKPLNGPNDVIVRSRDGSIYFTDPQAQQQSFEGLYRIAPATGTLTLLDQTMQYPNGLALSPDENTLYVAAAIDGKIYRFPVNADGTVGARSDFVQGLGSCDGLAVDDAGNVYVATTAGVRIYKADGSPRGSLIVPEPPSNLGFGGIDRKTLFISARTSIYQVQLQVPGRP